MRGGHFILVDNNTFKVQPGTIPIDHQRSAHHVYVQTTAPIGRRGTGSGGGRGNDGETASDISDLLGSDINDGNTKSFAFP